MQRLLYLLLFMILLLTKQTIAQDNFTKTQDFLQEYVTDGVVNYSAIAEKDGIPHDILYDISHNGLKGRSKEYRAAFYINTYNLLVIQSLSKNWPVKNPLEIEGFFNEQMHNITGERLTLDDLEKKLRNDYADARIHFVLVCGAVGCPPLSSDAYIPETLDVQLKERTKLALNDPSFVRVNKDGNGKLLVSKIFSWYSLDFGSSDKEIIQYINGFLKLPVPEDYALEFLHYDWSVNGH